MKSVWRKDTSMRVGLLLCGLLIFSSDVLAQPQLFFLHKKYDSRVELIEIPNTQAGEWRVCNKMKQQFIANLKNRREVMVAGELVKVENSFKILEITCHDVTAGEAKERIILQEREFNGVLEVKAIASEFITDFVRADSMAEVHLEEGGTWTTLSDGRIFDRMDLEHYEMTGELLLNSEGARVVGTLLQTAPDFKLRLYDRQKTQFLDLSPMDLMPAPDFVMDSTTPFCANLLR